MPTYISLINYTDQGIRNVKDSPKRLDAAKKLRGFPNGGLTTAIGEASMPLDRVAGQVFNSLVGHAG